jgi:hypothetical protein
MANVKVQMEIWNNGIMEHWNNETMKSCNDGINAKSPLTLKVHMANN